MIEKGKARGDKKGSGYLSKSFFSLISKRVYVFKKGNAKTASQSIQEVS